MPLAIIITIAGMTLGFAPLLFEHFRNMWARPEYQYFPFVIGATVWLLWQRGKNAAGVFPIANGKRTSTVVALCLAWLLLAAGIFFGAPLLAAAGAVIAAISAFHVFLADGKVTNRWGIWALLWLLVPLPLGMDRGLASWLQALSSRMSSGILDLLSINHAMAANVLQLPSKELFVDEACSGVVSVMSVITCGAIWAVWKNRSLLHSLLLIVSGVVWALSLNVARICVIAAAEAWFQVDLSSGTAHDVLGLALFLGTFLALVSTDQWLLFLLAPIQIDKFWSQHAGENWVADLWNRVVGSFTPVAVHRERVAPAEPSAMAESDSGSGGASPSKQKRNHQPLAPGMAIAPGIAFALLGLWQLPGMFTNSTWQASVDRANAIQSAQLPEETAGWSKVGFEESERDRFRGFADHSKVFSYQIGDEGPIATVSVDYPFAGRWHDLDNCYTSSGWTQTHLTNRAGGEDRDWEFVESKFERTDGKNGYLIYTFVDGDANKMQPPSKATILGPIIERMMESGAKSSNRRLFQIQLFLPTSREIDDKTRDAAEALFLESRERIRQFMETQ